MRRPTQIVTPLLAAAALSILAGCRPKEMQRCVDEHENVVDDKLCEKAGGAQTQQRVEQRPDGHGGFFPFFIPLYHPYYGGGGGYAPGSRVYGGTATPIPGRSYASPSRGGFFGRGGASRGGFGSSFSGGEGAGE